MRNRLRPMGRYPRRYQIWLAATVFISAMAGVPAFVQAAADVPPPSGVKVEEVVVSKTPHYTNIEATASGEIANYNS